MLRKAMPSRSDFALKLWDRVAQYIIRKGLEVELVNDGPPFPTALIRGVSGDWRIEGKEASRIEGLSLRFNRYSKIIIDEAAERHCDLWVCFKRIGKGTYRVWVYLNEFGMRKVIWHDKARARVKR